MKTKDKSRKWMWWFLGIVVALQLYFVRELLAAFAPEGLGSGSAARGGQRAPGCESGAARSQCRRRYGAAAAAASRLGNRSISFMTSFWLRPEHTQNRTTCLLQD